MSHRGMGSAEWQLYELHLGKHMKRYNQNKLRLSIILVVPITSPGAVVTDLRGEQPEPRDGGLFLSACLYHWQLVSRGEEYI